MLCVIAAAATVALIRDVALNNRHPRVIKTTTSSSSGGSSSGGSSAIVQEAASSISPTKPKSFCLWSSIFLLFLFSLWCPERVFLTVLFVLWHHFLFCVTCTNILECWPRRPASDGSHSPLAGVMHHYWLFAGLGALVLQSVQHWILSQEPPLCSLCCWTDAWQLLLLLSVQAD